MTSHATTHPVGEREPKPQRPRLLAKVCIFGAATLVAAAVTEVALRVLWSNPYQNEDASLVVVLQTQHANADRTLDRSAIDRESPTISLRTDARGYIEPAIRFDQPDYTVVFLGGSTTECSFVAESLRFPAHVSSLLEARGLRVNSLNFGRSGNNSHHSLNNFLNYVVADKPDAAVMMHAANDIGHIRSTGGYQTAMAHRPSLGTISRLVFQKASTKISLVGLVRHAITLRLNARELRNIGEATVPDRSDPLPPVDSHQFRQRLRAFVGVCRAFDVRPVLMTQPVGESANSLTPAWVDDSDQARFNQVIRDVAAEYSVDLIDLVRFIDRERAAGNLDKDIFYDAIHVNDYGSQKYADHIAERLIEILDTPRSQPAN